MRELELLLTAWPILKYAEQPPPHEQSLPSFLLCPLVLLLVAQVFATR
jgi:hypothetical protein